MMKGGGKQLICSCSRMLIKKVTTFEKTLDHVSKLCATANFTNSKRNFCNNLNDAIEIQKLYFSHQMV